MKTKNFLCTLITDVIINQSSATEGSQKTLDFIPGSNFLGIASNIYSTLSPKATAAIFHNNKVRFGDGHPAICSDGKWRRSLRIPASFFCPKLESEHPIFYVHHRIPTNRLKSEEIRNKQLKQCRSGFYVFQTERKIFDIVNIDKSFALKSAYSPNKRRAEDSKMYGYQSIDKDMHFCFSITYDESMEPVNEIINFLEDGEKRIGRSRTAQYGLVKIKELEDSQFFHESYSTQTNEHLVIVYSDSRLIFFDQYGLPTFTPQSSDFNIEGTIDWKMSQIRTFQYSPWNNKRGARDADRCGIEKGSVIVIRTSSVVRLDMLPQYVGAFQNEGFGKIICNPEFLIADNNGILIYKNIQKEYSNMDELEKSEKERCAKINTARKKLLETEDSLLKYLHSQFRIEKQNDYIYLKVANFINEAAKYRFDRESFASQWGTIRSIAMRQKDEQQLSDDILNYISSGISANKWNESGRKKALIQFMDDNIDNIRASIINLSAEMSKTYKKQDYE